ncbi:unnamed protein product [Urochloa humidicola]
MAIQQIDVTSFQPQLQTQTCSPALAVGRRHHWIALGFSLLFAPSRPAETNNLRQYPCYHDDLDTHGDSHARASWLCLLW